MTKIDFKKYNTGFIKGRLAHPVKRLIAKYYLEFLQKFTDIKVVGITGSAGKTTTKEMLASILKQNGSTVYTPANIDSVFNIPTTILKARPWTKYLVLEMGVEYPGEMDFYLWLARPDIGIITNIFPTHLEFLRSVEGVFGEKSKLALSLSKKSTTVLNRSDKKLVKLLGRLKAKIVWFDADNNPDVTNKNAATAVAKILEIPNKKIIKGLVEYKKPEHRLTFIKTKEGTTILDDSYNSNPEAFLSTLKYFIKESGKSNKIVVVGDMLELGKNEAEIHKETGREIARYNFQAVIGVGNLSKYTINEVKKVNPSIKVYHFGKQEETLSTIKRYLHKGNYILIKGSHSVYLDKLVNALV